MTNNSNCTSYYQVPKLLTINASEQPCLTQSKESSFHPKFGILRIYLH